MTSSRRNCSTGILIVPARGGGWTTCTENQTAQQVDDRVAQQYGDNRNYGYPCGTQSSGGRRQVRFEEFSFGSIRIDGVTYEHDVVIDRAEVRKRKKKDQPVSVVFYLSQQVNHAAMRFAGKSFGCDSFWRLSRQSLSVFPVPT